MKYLKVNIVWDHWKFMQEQTIILWVDIGYEMLNS